MAERTDICVVVADDHPLVVQMLALVVGAEDGLSLVAECRDGQQALDAILANSPDVALLDVAMPRLRGPEVARLARDAGSRTRLIFLSGHSDPELLRECIAAGGAGFVSKTAARADVVAAIRTVAAGRTAFPADGAPYLAAGSWPADSVGLTPQERRVLQLAAEGRSNAAIAASLYIAQTTVKTHLRHAANRLGVSGRAATIAEAMRKGLIG